MRLSTRRLEALIQAARRGIDEWEAEDDDEMNGDIEAALEGLDYLHEILRNRQQEEKVTFRDATEQEKAAVIAWARKA
jgi:hypothetical protein